MTSLHRRELFKVHLLDNGPSFLNRESSNYAEYARLLSTVKWLEQITNLVLRKSWQNHNIVFGTKHFMITHESLSPSSGYQLTTPLDIIITCNVVNELRTKIKKPTQQHHILIWSMSMTSQSMAGNSSGKHADVCMLVLWKQYIASIGAQKILDMHGI